MACLNVLFIENLVDPQKGGIQRVTYTLASALKEYGVESYVVYELDDKEAYKTTDVFRNSLKFSFKRDDISILKNFCIENKIKIVINQLPTYSRIVKQLYSLKKDIDLSIISELHTSPNCTWESSQYKDWRYPMDTLRSILKRTILFFFRFDVKKVRYAYDKSDRFILLSQTFILPFRLNNKIDGKKLSVIPNPATYSHNIPDEDLLQKEDKILVVSRLNENPKRISKILDIWQILQNKHKTWHLYIVGDGSMLNQYKKQAEIIKLERIHFEGYKDPLPYYKCASIFLMTSIFEGMPMTLIEAQQNGVVPVAFNTYSSLNDIITNNYNGRIIENDNIIAFSNAVSELINDTNKRYELARNGLQTVKKFSVEFIAKQWINLFNSL